MDPLLLVRTDVPMALVLLDRDLAAAALGGASAFRGYGALGVLCLWHTKVSGAGFKSGNIGAEIFLDSLREHFPGVKHLLSKTTAASLPSPPSISAIGVRKHGRMGTVSQNDPWGFMVCPTRGSNIGLKLGDQYRQIWLVTSP
jgi:hypothetical protein